jgi:IclR family pca regulon transcriptional regulator
MGEVNDGDHEPLQQRDFISSLAKGLDVLRAFTRETPQLSTADLANHLHISRASARRFLLTLASLGYLHKQGQWFWPTSKVLSLSNVFLSSMPLASIAQPFLESGTQRMDESCSLGILEHNKLVFVAHSPSRWLLRVGIRAGAELDAYVSAMGRVLLAAMSPHELDRYLDWVELKQFTDKTVRSKAGLRKILAQVREQRHAVIDQELELGLRSIAVPLVHNGRTIAAVGTGCQSNRATLRRLKQEFLPVIRDVAAGIAEELSRS